MLSLWALTFSCIACNLERIQMERSSVKMSRVVKWTTLVEKKKFDFYLCGFFLPWVWSLQKVYHVWLFGSLFFITWINESSCYTSCGKLERIRKKWPISGSKWQKKCYEKSSSNLCFLFLSVFSSGLQEVKQSLSRIGQWNKGVFFGWVLPLPLEMYVLLLHFRSFSFLLAMDSACYFYHLADLFQLKKMWRAYLVLSRQLLVKKENHLLLLLEHRVKENYTGICA